MLEGIPRERSRTEDLRTDMFAPQSRSPRVSRFWMNNAPSTLFRSRCISSFLRMHRLETDTMHLFPKQLSVTKQLHSGTLPQEQTRLDEVLTFFIIIPQRNQQTRLLSVLILVRGRNLTPKDRCFSNYTFIRILSQMIKPINVWYFPMRNYTKQNPSI